LPLVAALGSLGSLGSKDLRAILRFLGDAATIRGPSAFTVELLDDMAVMFGARCATYNEFDFARRTVLAYVTCTADGPSEIDMTLSDWEELTAELVVDRDIERDGIVATSDRRSCPERLRGDRARADRQESAVVDTMCARIGPPGARFVLDRVGRDFDDRDRAMMRVLQPHLLELWRRASTRRRLDTVVDALGSDDTRGVVLVDEDGDVESASAAGLRLLQTHFGHAVPLPDRVARWWHNGRTTPLVVEMDDAAIVVEAVDNGSTLVVREQAPGLGRLTRREFEVMRCVAAGLTNEEVAKRLWIGEPTVRKHLEHVYDKLHVRTRTAAVAALRLSTAP
jgi:DNA-binding CsgD family transcriptional regulator